MRSRTSWFLARKAMQSGVQGFMRHRWHLPSDRMRAGWCRTLRSEKRHRHCANLEKTMRFEGKQCSDLAKSWKFFRCVACPISLVAITICGSWPILDVACRADCPSNNEASTSRLMVSGYSLRLEPVNASTRQRVSWFTISGSTQSPSFKPMALRSCPLCSKKRKENTRDSSPQPPPRLNPSNLRQNLGKCTVLF